ncbi:hypothetical protein Tco_1329307 [Tanacetum coccineum]
MAQPQRPADVHQDELCPPNKRYALMDANKKIDLDNPLYPNERKIMANIIQNHPLRFSVAASSSMPWFYLGQFWHTLQEDLTDILKMDKNEAKPSKRLEEREKSKAEGVFILNGPTRTHLMGRVSPLALE